MSTSQRPRGGPRERPLGQDEALGALKFVAQELSEPCRPWPRSFWAPPLVAQELPDQEIQKLINHLKSLSKSNNWDGIRWITHSSNENAKKLYNKIANNTGFELYELK